jgi:hypothetical protein
MKPAYILRDVDRREHAITRIRMLNLNGEEPWAIWIGPYKQIRTLEANALYWATVDEVCEATGHSRNVIHTFLKKEAWGVEIAEINGKVVEVVKSSAKANRGEFSELLLHAQELRDKVCAAVNVFGDS